MWLCRRILSGFGSGEYEEQMKIQMGGDVMCLFVCLFSTMVV
jgi:hypothetical protein